MFVPLRQEYVPTRNQMARFINSEMIKRTDPLILRQYKLPGNSWRMNDPGHFHIEKR